MYVKEFPKSKIGHKIVMGQTKKAVGMKIIMD